MLLHILKLKGHLQNENVAQVVNNIQAKKMADEEDEVFSQLKPLSQRETEQLMRMRFLCLRH